MVTLFSQLDYKNQINRGEKNHPKLKSDPRDIKRLIRYRRTEEGAKATGYEGGVLKK